MCLATITINDLLRLILQLHLHLHVVIPLKKKILCLSFEDTAADYMPNERKDIADFKANFYIQWKAHHHRWKS